MEISAGPPVSLRIAGCSIHSSRAPEKEALRFLEPLFSGQTSNTAPSPDVLNSPPGPRALLICGLGLGFILEALDEMKVPDLLDSSGMQLYLYEPCSELRQQFSELGIQRKIQTLCEHRSIHYLSESNWQAPPSRLSVHIFPSYQRHFPALASAFRPDRNQNTLNRLMRAWKRNFRIRAESSPRGKHKFLRMPESTSFVFLGASPNLEDYSLQRLVELRSSYILLCSDTALGYCLSKGLIPNLVLCVDPAPATGYHLLQGLQSLKERNEVPLNLLTFSGGPRFHHTLNLEEYLYESDFPPEQRKGWQGISNSVGNLAGLAISLVGSASNNDLLLLGSDGVSLPLQSHCRGTGYEYFARQRQNRLESMDTYFYSLVRRSYTAQESQKIQLRMEEAARRRNINLYRYIDADWESSLQSKQQPELPGFVSHALTPDIH